MIWRYMLAALAFMRFSQKGEMSAQSLQGSQHCIFIFTLFYIHIIYTRIYSYIYMIHTHIYIYIHTIFSQVSIRQPIMMFCCSWIRRIERTCICSHPTALHTSLSGTFYCEIPTHFVPIWLEWMSWGCVVPLTPTTGVYSGIWFITTIIYSSIYIYIYICIYIMIYIYIYTYELKHKFRYIYLAYRKIRAIEVMFTTLANLVAPPGGALRRGFCASLSAMVSSTVTERCALIQHSWRETRSYTQVVPIFAKSLLQHYCFNITPRTNGCTIDISWYIMICYIYILIIYNDIQYLHI